MSLESLWDPDFALLLAESTPLPGDVFSLLDEVHGFAKDPINAENCHGKRKMMMRVLHVLLRSVALQHH